MVIKPSSIPKVSLITLANGAKQLVVQEAFETTEGSYVIIISPGVNLLFMSFLYCSWLTPITNMGASADGAEITTRLAPPSK